MSKDRYFVGRKCSSVLLLVCITASVGFLASLANSDEINTKANSLDAFLKAVEASDDLLALSLGDSIFSRLEEKYRNDIGFRAYKSKLNAAQFLARQMQQQLKAATNTEMLTVADEFFGRSATSAKSNPLSIAPAKNFYETSVQLFSRPVTVPNLTDEERTFLAQYYDLKLRTYSNAVAKAGQALAIAQPGFTGTHDYVLVLPLLHASVQNSFSINVLPRWMQRSEQLDIFSDSCLLQFGFPFHAMMLAEKSAEVHRQPFSQLDFYRSAARKCGKWRPHIAADCLRRAMDYVPGKEPDETIALRFEIVQLWLDSQNYRLAAGQARQIFEAFPNHNESGKATWLYYYALSRSNDIHQILADIDKVLADKRCEAYKPKLMYIKWWTLRRKRDETARVAALEYELLKQYGNDPMVAPILLSRSTDLLARQDYNGAYELLTQLVEKFPSTKAAAQAKKMLAKLKETKGI